MCHPKYKTNIDLGEQVRSEMKEGSAKCILIATGAAYRKLSVDGCEWFEGSGTYYAATAMEGELCHGAQIVIVGDGNSAGQAAVFLSERAQDVRAHSRRSSWRAHVALLGKAHRADAQHRSAAPH
jgi:thioredoxin reductase